MNISSLSFGEHALASGALVRDFGHREMDELADPADRSFARRGLQHLRSDSSSGIERPRVAGEIAATSVADGTPSFIRLIGNGPTAGTGDLDHVGAGRFGAHSALLDITAVRIV